MPLDTALLTGYGKEYLGDAVPNIVSDNIADEKHRQPYAHNRINEVEPVGTRHRELLCEDVLYLGNEPLQQKSCAGREDTDEEADEQHEGIVGKMPPTPAKQVGYDISIIHFLIIFICPSRLNLIIWLGLLLLRSFWRERMI